MLTNNAKEVNIVNTLQANPEKSRDFIFQNPGIPPVLARFKGCAWQSGEDLQAGQKTKERKKKGYFCEPGKKRLILSTTVHSKKNTCFQEIIIRTHLFFLGGLVESEMADLQLAITHIVRVTTAQEIIIMIVTDPILMATGVASNSILVTLAPLCLALGLT